MASDRRTSGAAQAPSRWWERLNRALFPYLGPAQLGPFGEDPLPPTTGSPCPLCGQPMSAHTVERPGGNASSRLRCPSGASTATSVT